MQAVSTDGQSAHKMLLRLQPLDVNVGSFETMLDLQSDNGTRAAPRLLRAAGDSRSSSTSDDNDGEGDSDDGAGARLRARTQDGAATMGRPTGDPMEEADPSK